MALTSFLFLILLLCTAIMYYVLPCKVRFLAILLANGFFLSKCNSILENAIWLAEAALVYATAYRTSVSESEKERRILTFGTVIVLAAALILMKESAFFGIKDFGNLIPSNISWQAIS